MPLLSTVIVNFVPLGEAKIRAVGVTVSCREEI
jgi:hypothetical protein